MNKPESGPQKHHRRSIRLKGYDYASAGAYFVTIVTQGRECLFGEIVDGEMQLNVYGHAAEECWRAIPGHFPNVELGAYVIMPNHVHGIIIIRNDESMPGVWAQHAAPIPTAPSPTRNVTPGSLGAIIRSFKSAVTRDLGRKSDLRNVWQRNYYEHIIRNEKEMARIWDYIESNPAHWDPDKENW